MNDGLDDIRSAIKKGQTDQARQMLRNKLMSNPSAEVYFLASWVATSEEQRRDFLEKALALDPFHQGASDALHKRDKPQNAARTPPDVAAGRPPVASGSRVPNAAGMQSHALADLGPRFFSYLIDTFILVGILVFLSFFFPPPVSDGMTDDELIDAFADWYNQFLFLFLAVQSVYYVFFLTQNNGQTPGKRIMKMRVAKLDGTPITLMDAIVRNVVGYFVSNLLFSLGFIWAFFDDRRQTWHDKLAKTVVVRTE